MACVVAMVDLFVTDPDRSVDLLADAGLAGRRRAAAALVASTAASRSTRMQRMVVADPMGHLLACFATLAMMVTLVYARPYVGARDMLKGEFFTLAMFVAARHPGDGLGQQLPGRLPRPRADVAVAVRAGRAAPRPRRRDRGGDEVLRARRAGQRLPALRPVDDVRRHRLARHPRGLQGDRHRPDQPRGADLRHRVRRRRPGLQARRGAVPHVGARRLPGRADGGDAADRRRARSSPPSRSRSACWSRA